jgi:hypothetical protein
MLRLRSLQFHPLLRSVRCMSYGTSFNYAAVYKEESELLYFQILSDPPRPCIGRLRIPLGLGG